MWLGENAITGYTDLNQFEGTIALTEGQLVPIRLQYGNAGGQKYLDFSWSDDYTPPVPPVMDNFFIGSSSNASATTIVVSAIPPYSVVVISAGVEVNAIGTYASISSILYSGGNGLTFVKRSEYADPNSLNSQKFEVWYAINDSSYTLTGFFNVNYDQYFDDQSTTATIWTGCNLTTPWSTNAPVTSQDVDIDGHPTITIPTVTAGTTGVIFSGIPRYFSLGTPTDWTLIVAVTNNGAVNWEYTEALYKQFSTSTTNLVVTFPHLLGSGNVGLTIIADALVGI
jgi:hypothetical protein